jgi:hypothetical protein
LQAALGHAEFQFLHDVSLWLGKGGILLKNGRRRYGDINLYLKIASFLH